MQLRKRRFLKRAEGGLGDILSQDSSNNAGKCSIMSPFTGQQLDLDRANHFANFNISTACVFEGDMSQPLSCWASFSQTPTLTR